MQISNIISFLDGWANPSLAEDYDNVGLLVGRKERDVSRILVSLDTTEEVVEEAKKSGCELIVSHHPILFKGLKRLNGQNYVARTIENALINQIGIFGLHTNLDSIQTGVNAKMASRLALEDIRILKPTEGKLVQLYFYVPFEYKEKVVEAVHKAGAGEIGNYNQCSFSTEGKGRFLPNHKANPSIGKNGILEELSECKIEVILPKFLKNKVLTALIESHPYEEVSYGFVELDNEWQEVGSGMVGNLANPIPKQEFMDLVKRQFNLTTFRYTQSSKEMVEKVALCGGSGFFLLNNAKQANADVFITSDIKYHEFFDAEGKITLMDIGHYESEQFTSELIMEKLSNEFPNIAVLLSKTKTNPVFYA